MGNPVRPLDTSAAIGPVLIPAERELPPPSGERTTSALNQTASRVGNFMGITVERIRDLPRRVSDMRQRLVVVRGRASEDASTAAAQWKQTARQKFYHARNRADYLGHEYPLQMVAGAAGVAFVFGLALRIWRSRYAHD